MLYQLSYFRNTFTQRICKQTETVSKDLRTVKAGLHSLFQHICGQRWIRTTEVERQQIYSLPHLAALEFARLSLFQKTHLRLLHKHLFSRASCRIRTNDPEITNHVLWPTELKRHRTICGVLLL